jgi:hypothetical protein
MHRTIGITIFTTALCLSHASFGDYVSIDTVNGSFNLEAGQISGILDGDDNSFSMNDLDILAQVLQNDGIETEGRLSFLLASTDSGMSFIGLFGGVPMNTPSGSLPDQFIGISATTGSDTDWFASGDSGSDVDWYDMGNNTQLVTALLAWDEGQTSAGFAWSDVTSAQNGTTNLYDVDFTEYAPDPIQFISYGDEGWSVAEQAAFSVLGQYAFSHQFVPAPGAIALLALAGLGACRRRRT